MISLHKDNLKHWQDNNLEARRYEYKIMPGDYCIDIGSYQNEWSDRMIYLHKVEVECFEALDNRAAWLYNGDMEIGGAYYYSSPLLPAVGTVKCVDILPFIEREIAVCKINIEGGEYHLLPYMMPLIKNIRNLQVQFHLVEGLNCEKAYEKIAESLSLTHEIDWRVGFVWESWKRKLITNGTEDANSTNP